MGEITAKSNIEERTVFHDVLYNSLLVRTFVIGLSYARPIVEHDRIVWSPYLTRDNLLT